MMFILTNKAHTLLALGLVLAFGSAQAGGESTSPRSVWMATCCCSTPGVAGLRTSPSFSAGTCYTPRPRSVSTAARGRSDTTCHRRRGGISRDPSARA